MVMTIGLLIAYSVNKDRLFLKVIGVLWGMVFLLFIVNGIIRNNERPIRLTKEDIVGVYRVDRSFYPGKNAEWQYRHLNFEITKDDRFILKVLKDDGKLNVLRGKVRWEVGPPDFWSLEMKSGTHHLIKEAPTLYRGPHSFYYVFRSDWGNVFFRKVKQ